MPKRLFIGFVLSLLAGQAVGQERLMLQPERDDLRNVELFVAMPEGGGPFPIMLFVHGHQTMAQESRWAVTARLCSAVPRPAKSRG